MTLKSKLKIKAQPNASKDEIVGFLGESLKIRVKAAPESGKANIAIERLLAQTFNLKRKQIRIISGTSSRHKIVELSGISQQQLSTLLQF